MKRFIAAFAALALASGAMGLARGAAQETAEQIIAASRSRIKADTVSTRSRMVIADKGGGTTERLIDQYTSDSGGLTKTVVVFQKPASVAGTRFLTIENKDATEDRWIFLPALGKARRVSAGEGSGSFMGTDLSYDDVSSANRAADKDNHAMVRDESLGGKPCWLIESRPKDSGYQYSRMLSWVEKASYIALKIELYDKKGALAKVMEVLKVEDRQGKATPVATRMSTVKAKTSTTIYFDIVKYDEAIPPGVFTTKFLETGRP